MKCIKPPILYAGLLRSVVCLAMLLLVNLYSVSAQIVQAEYFIDTDPGVGNGIVVNAVDGNLDNAIEQLFAAGINMGSPGLHSFNIRVKDVNNNWGPVFRMMIEVVTPLSYRDVRIDQAELFWDTDPGLGNGIPMLAFDGNFNTPIEDVIRTALPAPSLGMHVLHVRIKDPQNNWSPAFKYVVNVEAPLAIRNVRISQAELYLDSDPGQGNGIPMLAFDGNFNDAIESVVSNPLAAPSPGLHVLHVRVRDHLGVWGTAFRQIVNVATPFVFRPIRIDEAELFWDTDPGTGNGTPLLAFDGNYDQAIEEALASISAPSVGYHVLHVRVKDVMGAWSQTFKRVVEVTGPMALRSIQIKQGEFFFDTDPGQGSGYPLLALDGNFDNALEQLKQDWSFLADTGLHVLNVRTQDANNQWGPVFKTVVKILPCVSQPVVSITPNATQMICPGDQLTFTAPGGFTSYTWFRGGTQVGTGTTYIADTTGFYRVYVTDANGCGAYSAFTEVMQVPVNVNIAASGPLTFCQGHTVTLNAGNGYGTYLWNTGATTQHLTVGSAGQYIVTVTTGSCIGIDTVNVTVNPLPNIPIISANGPTTFCAGGNVDLTASSAPNYYWNTFETTSSIHVTQAGIYTVTITDNNGCTRTNQTVVSTYPPPISGYSASATICQGDTAQLFVNGGVSYQWTPVIGISNPTIANPRVSPPVSTQYRVISTGIGGCVDSAFVNVFVNPSPTVTASSVNPSCEGETLLLQANPSGADSYTWSGPNGFVAYGQNPVVNNVSMLNNGTYIVTATNAGGCYATSSVTVSGINPKPTVSINGNFSLCNGEILSLNVLPSGLDYQWTGPNNFQSTLQNPQILNVDPVNAGNYNVVVTNGTGCSAAAQANVTVGVAPVLSVGGTTQVCEGGTISLGSIPSGLLSYQWTGPNNFTSLSQQFLITNAGPQHAGWYVLNAGNGGNCNSKDSVLVNVNPVPVAQILNAVNEFCAGESITWMGMPSGMQAYAWTGPNGFVSTEQSPVIPSLQPFNTGAYNLSVTNSFGCSSSASYSIAVYALPIPNATTNAPIVCEGDTLRLFANPLGMTYQWSSPNGFSSGQQNPVINSAVIANTGTYFLTVTDGNGCSATTQTEVYVSGNPQISFVNNTIFCEQETLQLFASPSGMATYQWIGPNNFSNALQNPAIPQITLAGQGYYVLQVMNNYGCTDIDSIYINVYPKPEVIASGNGTLCEGDDLLLAASPSGWESYSWTGPDNFISNLQNPTVFAVDELNEGSYIVTVTNTYGCTDSDVFFVNVHQGPTISVTFLSPLCAGETLSFNTVPSGMISYSWTGPDGFVSSDEDPVIANVTEDNAGVYTVTVSNGLCSTTLSNTVMVNSMPNTDVLQIGSVLTSLQGGASYQWLNCADNTAILGEFNQTYTAQQNGSYAVAVIVNGCVDTTACYDVVGLSLLEESTSWNWGIYPNPNEGHFFIQATQPAVYELTDMSGKLLGIYEVIAYPYEVKVILPAGMYFVREQQSGTVQKVIVK